MQTSDKPIQVEQPAVVLPCPIPEGQSGNVRVTDERLVFSQPHETFLSLIRNLICLLQRSKCSGLIRFLVANDYLSK